MVIQIDLRKSSVARLLEKWFNRRGNCLKVAFLFGF